MKVYVLGSGGMLGRYVWKYLESKHEVMPLTSKDVDVSIINESNIELFFPFLKAGDVVVNCAGTIKPMVDKYGTLNAIRVNSVFPHVVESFCKTKNVKFIHITTDCVFSGKDGLYDENSKHDCQDVYGKTKSLGEVSDYGTVIRTSIVGEELHTTRSLIEWIKSMKGNSVNGFTNHKWNGITCLQVAKIIENIITKSLFWNGVRHIFSPNIVTKFELLKMVSDIYNLDITVNSVESDKSCDRTMTSVYDNSVFNIPVLEVQIQEQKNFYNSLK